MHSISHPSKEQVRAYMRRREQALQPPPAPDEIRRQLAWCTLYAGMDASADAWSDAKSDAKPDAKPDASAGATAARVAALGWYLLAEMSRLATLMAIAWLMDSGVPQRKN